MLDRDFFIELILNNEMAEHRLDSLQGDHFYPHLATTQLERWKNIERMAG